MAKEDINDLLRFLMPFPDGVKDLALWLREFVWDLYPGSNELIYDNYNALAIGWSTTDRLGDTFCSIAAFGKYVHFGFYRGCDIADPEKRLIGNGKQYRYIIVKNKNDFPKTYVKKLLKEAHAHAMFSLKDGKQSVKGQSITKSISPVKRRPG
mgnify:CR=1 FL=1